MSKTSDLRRLVRPILGWSWGFVDSFRIYNWFLSTVVGVTTDEGETYYQIDYDDCDQEELDGAKL